MTIPESAASPRARPWDLALFLLALFLGLALIVAGAFQGRFDDLWKEGWPARLRGGELAAQLNHSLPYLPAFEIWASYHRQGAYLLAGSYGPQVRQGCASWLFLQEELQAAARPAHNMRDRVAMVDKVALRLKREQVKLIVLMVPDKSRVLPQAECGLPRPVSYQGRLPDWNAALRSRDILVADATPAMASLAEQGKAAYWRLDSHWTQAGAAVAAQSVRQALLQADALPTAELTSERVVQAPRARLGDLIRLAGLENLAPYWLPAPDIETPIRFRHAALASATGSDDDLAAQLFGDAVRPPLVLVGTSFSHAADFEGFLSESLALPVINMARDGGGMWEAMQVYLSPAAGKREWPSLLIWEIPERYIQAPLSPAEADWLATSE